MKWSAFSILAAGFLLPASGWTAASVLTVKAANPLPLVHTRQTIELSEKDLAPLGSIDLHKVHVTDAAGTELLCQAIDKEDTARPGSGLVIFQADFAPKESRVFKVSLGKKWEYRKDDFKVYGRFVPERLDDFAWENDRIAHRTFGKALETAKGESLTSSAIDIWSKRVPYLVIDKWYRNGDYHHDSGEGCDDYSAGPTCGCGGSGIWAKNRFWPFKNFADARVLANGPIRVLFELEYEPINVNDVQVSRVLRVSLDAGSQLDHFQAFFHPGNTLVPLKAAVGLKKVENEQKRFNAGQGWLAFWEPMENNLGQQGVAVIVDPKKLEQPGEDDRNNFLIVKTGPEFSLSYWAGFAWNKAGRINTAEAWDQYVGQFAQGLLSPVQTSVSSE